MNAERKRKILGSIPKAEPLQRTPLVDALVALLLIMEEFEEVEAGADPLDPRLARHWALKTRGTTGFIRLFELSDGTFVVDNTVTNEMNEQGLTHLSTLRALGRIFSWIRKEVENQEAIKTRLIPVAELGKL